MSQKDSTGYTYKGLVAAKYFPFVTARVALRYLERVINSIPALRTELAEAGYRNTAHSFSPKQVEILEKHLGKI